MLMRCGELKNKIQESFPLYYFMMNGKTWSVPGCRRLTSVGGCMNFRAKLFFFLFTTSLEQANFEQFRNVS
jgi:hypothetical protein